MWEEYPGCIDLADIAAVKAWSNGEATPDQQKRAFDCVVKRFAHTFQPTFVPENADASKHLEGSRMVGLKIMKARNVSIAEIEKAWGKFRNAHATVGKRVKELKSRNDRP